MKYRSYNNTLNYLVLFFIILFFFGGLRFILALFGLIFILMPLIIFGFIFYLMYRSISKNASVSQFMFSHSESHNQFI